MHFAQITNQINIIILSMHQSQLFFRNNKRYHKQNRKKIALTAFKQTPPIIMCQKRKKSIFFKLTRLAFWPQNVILGDPWTDMWPQGQSWSQQTSQPIIMSSADLANIAWPYNFSSLFFSLFRWKKIISISFITFLFFLHTL